MRLIVDGDACPVKDLIQRAALRLQVPMILVSNRPMAFGNEPGVTPVIVPEGPDQADRWIATEATRDDLVITADIPLAAEVVAKGSLALGHRGEVFDAASIGEYKARWTLMNSLRAEGLELGGPKTYGNKDRAAFANAFERLVQRLQKAQRP
ncbi:YaiI/YqxD family protein [bacterium]|nr:YaiI/YqxD family protein [bacterium]